MIRTGPSPNPRTAGRLRWLVMAIAVPLLITGVVMPNGLLIAAGLILAGLTGLADRH